jgi:hypothetical protein
MAGSELKTNIALVAQSGRIAYQALLSAASIRTYHPAGDVRIFVCVPNNSGSWNTNPSISEDRELLDAFERYGCEVVYFDNRHFGSSYPHSNKFYSILSLPPDEPFIFLDSDTMFVGRAEPEYFNFGVPGLSRAMPNWPKPQNSQYTIAQIWESLYGYYGLDPTNYFDRDLGPEAHQCYPYYQGNVMYYERAGIFGEYMLDMALRLWREQPKELEGQRLKPWLDQVVLPLVLARLGIPRREQSDLFRDIIVHYQYPVFLIVRNNRAINKFSELAADSYLVNVLRRDEGFGFYMSDEGRTLVKETYAKFMASGKKWDRNAFRDTMRRKAPTLR